MFASRWHTTAPREVPDRLGMQKWLQSQGESLQIGACPVGWANLSFRITAPAERHDLAGVGWIEYGGIDIIAELQPLTPSSFQNGLAALVARDRDLAMVVDRYGPPPMWRRKPCFATLVHIILEQQVSLASALAVYNRLAAIVAPFSAIRFRQIDRARIKSAGLTRQKLTYCYHLADAIAERQLSLNRLHHLSDAETRAALVKVKGIGPWTADIYLLMALRRPDIWPPCDLALKAALRTVKHLPTVPSEEAFAAIGNAWRPWRAVAARILWHFYLSTQSRNKSNTF